MRAGGRRRGLWKVRRAWRDLFLRKALPSRRGGFSPWPGAAASYRGFRERERFCPRRDRGGSPLVFAARKRRGRGACRAWANRTGAAGRWFLRLFRRRLCGFFVGGDLAAGGGGFFFGLGSGLASAYRRDANAPLVGGGEGRETEKKTDAHEIQPTC